MHQATLIMEDMCCSMTIPCVTSVVINFIDLINANLPGLVGLITAPGNIVLSFIHSIFSVIIAIGIATLSKPKGQRKTWKMP